MVCPDAYDIFGKASPLFTIEYKNVIALDQVDAANHCAKKSQNIFTILGYEKGQKPSHFATVFVDSDGKYGGQFHFPGYMGNLVSDFNPHSTFDNLQEILPIVSKSPWIDLLLNTYTYSMSERNVSVAYLKAWAVLELIAKRNVPENNNYLYFANGSPIIGHDNQQINTRRALGKVYWWLYSMQPNPHTISTEENLNVFFEASEDSSSRTDLDSCDIFSLWDSLRAAYEIRNAVAHSGVFKPKKEGSQREKLATKLFLLPHNLFLDYMRSLARFLLDLEIDKERVKN